MRPSVDPQLSHMIRNLSDLTQRTFDVVVVGGGIFGASAAWEAALRGFSVALVEKRDFCHATSANHFKMVHCGIRYLQHGDIRRLRESSRERSALLRIAPHLIHTLPIVIPTYGHGVKGKAFLGVGMFLYDALTLDRNRGLLGEKRVRPGCFLSSDDVLKRFPGIRREGLTGAAVFEEGQMYNPPRLVLAFVRSAVERGAVAANYLEVTGFLKKGGRVSGVRATDLIGGGSIDIRGRYVLNTAGPWAHRIMETDLGLKIDPRPTFSRDLAFVIPRRFASRCGLALATETRDADTIVDRGGRHLFAVPWRQHTLIGVWHKVFDQPPEALTVTEEELRGYAEEVNQAYPGLIPSLRDIQVVNMGLTLFGDEDRQGNMEISFGKRSQVIDHAETHGVGGLLTLIGVRATTARGMAATAMDLIARQMGKKGSHPDSATVPLHGGAVRDFRLLKKSVLRDCGGKLDEKQIGSLIRNYGSAYPEVLQYGRDDPGRFAAIPGSTVTESEVLHAVRMEMACRLSDVVLRRTDLGSGAVPSREALERCAALMAEELHWERSRVEREIAEVYRSYPWRGAGGSGG
jgi:glycerol-3-phosphate dehydrogenase